MHDRYRIRRDGIVVVAWTLLVACPVGVMAAVPGYGEPLIFARTGITSFNLPNGSSLTSTTIGLNDQRDVVVDINVVGKTGNPGLFFGQLVAQTPTGGIVANAADIITGDPQVNELGEAVFAVGLADSPFIYEKSSGSVGPINYPLGVTGSDRLRLTDAQLLGGRLAIGFTGDVYGTFNRQSVGLPALTLYATDDGVDSGSPYSFLFSPDTSQTGGLSDAPRMAAKVAATGNFDLEQIRIFDADGSTTLVAVETESDPFSPFSEFITNSVSISDDGTHVAFQATDLSGNSGIYRYDDTSGAIDVIAIEGNGLVNEIDIFAPDINNAGQVVFRGDDVAGRNSVFIGDGEHLIRVIGEGDTFMTDLGPRQLGRRDMAASQSGGPQINNRGDLGYIFQYFDPTNPGSVADGSLVMLSPAVPTGDFDGDGAYTCADIDALILAIVGGSNNSTFDLNGDGNVDLGDRDAWLAEAGAAQLTSGQPYLLGDTDLDGTVDGRDFLVWNQHKFTAAEGWCQADFNADGIADGQDFLIWNGHKFTSADPTRFVPEPTASMLAVWLLTLSTCCRWVTH